MIACKFCGHQNASAVGRCKKCGAWLSQEAGGGRSESRAPNAELSDASSEAPPDDAPLPDTHDVNADLLILLRAGNKIEAIKRYRARTGVGLKEAKDAVEALAAAHGVRAKAGGCGIVGLALVMLIIIGLVMLMILLGAAPAATL